MLTSELKSLQKKEGLTSYEIAHILGISEKTWEDWRSGRRKPRGPGLTLISWAIIIIENGSLTRADLLRKTGRTI